MLYKRNHICYNMYVRWLRESTETKGDKTMTNQNAYMQQLIINDNGVETVYVNICKYHPSSAKIVAWKNKMDKQYKINTTGHFEIKFKIGGERANGAGKNRALAKHYFDNFEATNTVTPNLRLRFSDICKYLFSYP